MFSDDDTVPAYACLDDKTMPELEQLHENVAEDIAEQAQQPPAKKARKDRDARGLNWVFTINNPTRDHLDLMRQYEGFQDHKVLVKSLKVESEIGEEKKTPHLQGAIQLAHPCTARTVKKILGGKCWVQIAEGSWDDQDYCLKDDVPIKFKNLKEKEAVKISFGEGWKGQGRRTELEMFKTAIEDRKDETDLLEHHIREVAKFPAFERRLKAHYAKKRAMCFRNVSVHVLFGVGGSGKSRRAMYNLDGSFKADTYVVPKTDNTKWFLDYEGESHIVLNDFYGGRMKWDRFLDVFDGHPFMVETKGGHTYAEWTRITVTSNEHPDKWYTGVGATLDTHPEFKRRFTSITELK